MQGQDAKLLARMKWIFRGLGVAMVPLTASMPQVHGVPMPGFTCMRAAPLRVSLAHACYLVSVWHASHCAAPARTGTARSCKSCGWARQGLTTARVWPVQSVFCYWVTSNSFSLIQSVVFKVPVVRRFLNLPDLAQMQATASGLPVVTPGKPIETFAHPPKQRGKKKPREGAKAA